MLTTTHLPPAHARIGYYAIAAGLVGRPVHIVYRDYPALNKAILFKRYASWVGLDRVTHIHCERDLRKLERCLLSAERDKIPRLVILTEAKLLKRTMWMLTSFRSQLSTSPAPVLMAAQGTGGRGELPDPTVELHGSSPQGRLMEEWLATPELSSEITECDFPLRVSFDKVARYLQPPAPNSGKRALPPIERKVVDSLLVGAALFRMSQCAVNCQTPSSNVASSDHVIIVEVDDYRMVREVLRIASTQCSEGEFEPLTLLMVRRANTYLRIRASRTANPIVSAGLERDCITRRELSDLGNIRGKTVLQLIKDLQAMGDEGLDLFTGLGITRPMDGTSRWKSDAPEHLATMLIEWSDKQVRTHFSRLHTEGCITFSRAARNQPWVYRLPESFEDAQSPFKSLPMPDDIVTFAPAPVCPANGADQNP